MGTLSKWLVCAGHAPSVTIHFFTFQYTSYSRLRSCFPHLRAWLSWGADVLPTFGPLLAHFRRTTARWEVIEKGYWARRGDHVQGFTRQIDTKPRWPVWGLGSPPLPTRPDSFGRGGCFLKSVKVPWLHGAAPELKGEGWKTQVSWLDSLPQLHVFYKRLRSHLVCAHPPRLFTHTA